MLSENAVGFRPNVYGCDKVIAESTVHLNLRHQDENGLQLLKRLFQLQQMQVEWSGDIRKLAANCAPSLHLTHIQPSPLLWQPPLNY